MAGDLAEFPVTPAATQLIEISTAQTLGEIEFAGGGVLGYTLGVGAALNLENLENNARLEILGGAPGTGFVALVGTGPIQYSNGVDSRALQIINNQPVRFSIAPAIGTAGTGGIQVVGVDGSVVAIDGHIGASVTGGLSFNGTTNARLSLVAGNQFGGNVLVGGGIVRINADSALGSAGNSLTLSGSGTLEVAGVGAVSTARTFNFTGANANIRVLNLNEGPGVTVGSTLSGTAKLVKTGAGTLTLGSAVNTFSGGIDLLGGGVAFSNVAALADSGVISLDGGGLRYTAGVNQTLQRALTFAGAGTIAVDGQFAQLTLGMAPSGSGTLIKAGAGALKIDAALPAALSLHIDGGIVDLSSQGQSISNLSGGGTVILGSSNLVVTPTLDQTWSGNVGGAGSFTMAGTRTLTLGSANGFSGGLKVTGGAVRFTSDAALGAANTPVTLDGGALQPGVAMSISRNLTLGAAGGTVNVEGASLTLAGRLTGSGALLKTGAGNLLLTNITNDYAGGTVLRQGTLVISNPAALGAGGLTLDGGRLDFTGPAGATLPGAVSVGGGGGTLHVPSISAVLTIGSVSGGGLLMKTGDGPLQLAAGASFNGPSLRIDGGTFDGASNALSLGTLSGSGTLAFGSGTLTLNPAVDAVFAGVISGSGPIVKNGARTLTLGDVNAFSGALTINAGAMIAPTDQALGQPSASVTLAGGKLCIGGTAPITTARSISIGAAGGTLDIQNPAGLALSTPLSAAGALVKSGPGALTLLAGSSATTLTIAGGELRLKDFGALSGATSLSVLGGGRFVIEQTPAVVSSGRYTGAMALHNGEFAYVSAGAVQIPEALGALSVSGAAIISVTPGAAGGTSLHFADLIREGRGTLLLRGNVNATPGATSVQVGFAGGVAGISDPGGSGPNSLPVVPYGMGSGNLTATLGDTLLTTLVGGEVRPLDASEYFAVGTPGGALGPHLNNRLTASPAAVTGTPRVNSLVIAAPVTLSGSGTLEVHSGAMLNSAPLTIDGLAVSFVTTPGYVHMGDSVTLQNGATFAGNAGLTLSASPLGPAVTLAFPEGTPQSFFGGMFVNGPVTVAFSNDNQFGGAGDSLSLAGGTLRFTPAGTHSLSPRAVALRAAGGTVDIEQAGATLTIPGVVSGAGALTKTGPGTLLLGAGNAYGGGTHILGGTLGVAGLSALGAAGAPLTISNATLQYDGATATLSQRLTLGGNATIDITSAATLTLGAAPGGSGSLTKSGIGTLKLSPDMTLPISALNVAAGTVDLDGNPHTLASLAGNGSLLISGAALTLDSGADVSCGVSIGGTGSLVKRGAGTLTLGAAGGFSGGTHVLGGTLAVASDAALGTGNVELDGATLRYGLSVDESTGRSFILGKNSSTIDVTAYVLSASGAIRGLDGLTKAGGGTLRLAGAITHDYAGPTTILDGAIEIAERRALLPVAAMTLGGAGSALRGRLILGDSAQEIGSLTIHGTPAAQAQPAVNLGSGSITLRGDLTLADAQGAPGAGFGAVIIGQEGAFLSLGDALRTFHVAGSSNQGADLTIDAALVRGGIIFNGAVGAGGAPAVLELKQPGTYSQGTIVQQGTLITRAADALGTGSLVVGTGAEAARVELGGTQTLAGLTTAGSGSATLHGEFPVIVDTADNSTFAGVLSGAMRFTKRGPGVLTLAAGNLHTGGTAVEGGTLVVPADSALGDSAGGVSFNGGTLKLSSQFNLAPSRAITLDALGGTIDTNGFDTTLSQTIGGAGGLAKLGSGKLVLAGTSTYAGATTIGAGIVQVGAGEALGSAVGGTIVTPGAQLLLSGPLTSAEPLTIGGAGPGNAGALRGAAGANVLSGNIGTNGNSATISIDGGSSLSIHGSIALGGAGTQLTLAGAGDGTISGAISPAQSDAGLTKTGPGTWTLSGANGYRGATIIEQGTLVVSSVADHGTGSFSSLGTGPGLTIGSALSQATLRYTGPTGATNRNVTLGGAGGLLEISSAPTTLTLSGPIMGSSLTKTGPGTLKLTGAPSFQGNTTVSQGTMEYAIASGVPNVGGAATLSIAAGATVVAGGSVDPFSDVVDRIHVVNDGALNITGGFKHISELTGPGTVAVSGNDTMLTARYVRQQSLSVGAGAMVSIEPDGGPDRTSRVESLSLALNSRMDLQDNDLILQATPATVASALAQVEADIARARGAAPDLWIDFGLTSTFAALNPLTTLAAVLNDDGQGHALQASHGGIALDTSSIIVKYTYNGDANADGRIDIDDYFRIDVGYANRASLADPLFAQGDFDYDGDIDADDYFLIDQAFVGQSGAMSATPIAGPTSVPEPGLMALGCLAGAMLRRRRR